MITPEKILQGLQSLTSTKALLIAYSGGLDSHVLLHLASQFPNYQIKAIHVHHGLQEVASSWVTHCQNICDELGVSLDVVHLNLKPKKGESIEDIARKGRYKAFKERLSAGEVLLTAHHQNDQSETLLLQLFRGAGVQGLASMPLIFDFGDNRHARPLLNESLSNLERYAKENSLKFIEDPSNKDVSFDRNFLRQEIFPKLRERWNGIDKTLSRAARIQAETKGLLDDLAEQDLKLVHSEKNNTLSIKSLLKLSERRQKLLLRFWIAKSGFSFPSEKKLKHIFSDVVSAREDAQPLVAWQGSQVRRFKHYLYIMSPLEEHDNSQVFDWITEETILIPSLDLTLKKEDLKSNEAVVTIHFRQGGEDIHLTERKVTMSLKKYLNEMEIPPWMRSRIPLIYVKERLIQVIDSSKKSKN